MTRVESSLKGIQRLAARVTKDQIEIGQPAWADVGQRFASCECFECDWRVEIAKHSQVHIRRRDELGGVDTVRAIRGDYGNVRLRDSVARDCANFTPVVIEKKFDSGQLDEVSMSGVVRNVSFEERDAMTAC
jgi:hypothetical protein